MTTQTEQKKCDNCSEFGECCQTQPEHEPVAFKPPAKWRDDEIANGYRGIRWVAADGVYGRPTQEDVEQYLGYTHPPVPTAQPKEPEQEPVAIRLSNGVIDVLGTAIVPIGALLYTTPPQRTTEQPRQWVGLTKKDMDWLHENTPCIEGNYGYRFIKAIEAKLKEKNT